MCDTDKKKGESGFSLLEVLIALAIMSVLSLALFQSTMQLLSVSDRSVRASGQTIDGFTLRQSVLGLVQNLTPGWDEQPESAFSGGSNGFKGLSVVEGVSRNSGLALVSLSLQSRVNQFNKFDLVLSSPAGEVVLKDDFTARAHFSYLGWDQNWYEIWPPAEVPATGYFDDSDYADMPPLPLAIRIADDSSDTPFVLIASRKQTEYPPIRQDDVAR